MQQPAGGGFMRSAMTTAAGVAGGMLLAEGIRNMLGGSSAHATPYGGKRRREAEGPGRGRRRAPGR